MNISAAEAQTDLERLGDEIAVLSAHLDAATARLLDLIREFDARGGWGNGFRSCAGWLSWRVGFAPGAAREHVRVARALGTLPRLSQALARGELSYAKVRELTRVATPETEERLLAVGRAGTAEHVERIIRGWRRVDRKAEAEEAARQHARRALHVYHDEDGTVRICGRLAPEVGALLLKALEAARETLYQRRREQAPDADPPTMAQQQADALAVLAETALHHGIDPGAPGGPTTLSNLALLCRRHHRAVHEEGYQVERQPDGELQFRRPNGWVIPEVPPSPDRAEDPAAAIRTRNEREGLALHARTAMPGWLGERLDCGLRDRRLAHAGGHATERHRGHGAPRRGGWLDDIGEGHAGKGPPDRDRSERCRALLHRLGHAAPDGRRCARRARARGSVDDGLSAGVEHGIRRSRAGRHHSPDAACAPWLQRHPRYRHHARRAAALLPRMSTK